MQQQQLTKFLGDGAWFFLPSVFARYHLIRTTMLQCDDTVKRWAHKESPSRRSKPQQQQEAVANRKGSKMTTDDEPQTNTDLESSIAQAKNEEQSREEELSVLRLSKNDTWQNMNMRRKSSFAGDDGPSPPPVAKEEAASVAKRRRSWKHKGPDSRPSTYIVDDNSTVVESILCPDRLNSLLACDINTLTYDPHKWNVVLALRGRNIQIIALPLGLLTAWGLFWTILLSYDEFNHVRDTIAELEGLIGPLLVPVSFLLVFRLGRAAVRFWDARKAVGKIVEMCRVFVSTASVACVDLEDKSSLDDIARWTCVFPIAVKNFLQPSSRKGWDRDALIKKRRFEIGSLLSNEEADEVLNTSDNNLGPILVLNKLRKLVWKLTFHRSAKTEMLGPRDMLYQQLNVHLDTLTGAWGACERINGTPLPLVYVVHLRTFLLLYLILWQMEAAANHGWVALPTAFAASWGLLGIEAAAVECERPFQWHGNHLPLGKMCVVSSRNVAQILSNMNI